MNLESCPSYPSSSSTSQPPQLKVVTGRRTWKNLKGKNEAVWPPYIEAILIEASGLTYIIALEKYRPGASASTKLLGRFPKRNRFISDYIYKTTGKRRNPKQVGSRIQQLRDTCDDPHIQQLLSRTRYLQSGGSDTSSEVHRSPVSSEYSHSVPASPSDYHIRDNSSLELITLPDSYTHRYSPPLPSPHSQSSLDDTPSPSLVSDSIQPELDIPRTHFEYTASHYSPTTTSTSNGSTHWPVQSSGNCSAISADGITQSYSIPTTIYQTSPTSPSTKTVSSGSRVLNTFDCVSSSCSQPRPPLHPLIPHNNFNSYRRSSNYVYSNDEARLPVDRSDRFSPAIASFSSVDELAHRVPRMWNNSDASFDSAQQYPRIWGSIQTQHLIDPLLGQSTAWGAENYVPAPSRSSLSSALLPSTPVLQPIAVQAYHPQDPRQLHLTYPGYL
jgi:hypothetical protein